MTTPNCWSDSERRSVREALDRVLKSGPFHQSRRRQRFLEYVVDETLAGRSDRLKAYTVAVEVFDRAATFDPVVDPLVRIEAGRLRDKLREYYENDGRDDPVRIELPKGSYTPQFEFRNGDTRGPVPGEPDAASHKLLEPAPAAAEPGVEAPRPATPSPPKSRLWLMAVPALALVVALMAAGMWKWASPTPPPFSLSDKPSIAVLPFDNIGDDPKWERFADGITEDIITDLSHSKDFVVIARSSTAIYKGKPLDVRKVGHDLNVKYVLEGSIQPMGERIRVTAQLIEAASGSHTWSERYDRPVDDLFAVQNDVTGKIAATLVGYQGSVAEAERSLIRRKPPASLTAYDTYLLGIEAKHRVTKESLIEAERLLRKAIELDPQLARAYVGLVDVQCYVIDLGLAPSVEEAVSKMMEAGQMAVKLDPDDGKTHLALAFAYSYQGKPQQAAAEYDKAEALAPTDADVLLLIAWGIPGLGQSARAVGLAERSLALNPHYPDWYNQGLSVAFLFGGEFEKALKYRLLVKEPLAIDYAFVAIAHAYLGHASEAAAASASVAKLDPAWNAEKYLSEAGGYADMEAELFVEGARKAGLRDCVAADKAKDMPDLIRVKSCDAQRARISG